tara:strand:- start:363 stop:572 length:210 start_codon:yes stop_codon:yes gene_type:complete
MPRASIEICKADVQEFTEIAYLVENLLQNIFSNLILVEPFNPLLRVEEIYFFSKLEKRQNFFILIIFYY